MSNPLTAITLAKTKLGHFVLVGLVALGVGGYLHKRFTPPTIHTVTVKDVQTVTVDVPVLTEKVIDRIITDPKQQRAISALMKENNELKLKVTQVVSTEAHNSTSGGTQEGPLAGRIETPVQQDPAQPSTRTFQDYQLTARFNSTEFSYDLDQKFILETSTAKDPNGQLTTLVKLYQDSPTGLRPVPAQSISVNSNPDVARWIVSPRLQGGLLIGQDKSKGGFVGLQFLKHGTSRDPKDLRWAVGTVGLKVGDGGVQPTILPISFNLGSIPNQPLSNIWVSVSVDKSGKLGISFTSTF